MSKVRFEAQLIEGHKGFTVVLVPFDHEARWRQKPVRLAGRRHGRLVKGSANGRRFNSYIGDRWGRFFIALAESLREAAGLAVGDGVSMVIEPSKIMETYLSSPRTIQGNNPAGQGPRRCHRLLGREALWA